MSDETVIEIAAGFEGVVPTAPYANARPSFFAKIILKNGSMNLDEIAQRQRELFSKVYGNFKEEEQKLIVERIERERKDFRFYFCAKCQLQHPSVTSIIGFDADFFQEIDALRQYQAQGNLIDAQTKHFIKTGKWVEPKDIDGTWTDLLILKQGSEGLAVQGWDFPAFLKKYPLENMSAYDTPILNHQDQYAGTPDFTAVFEGRKTICDIKRTADKVKNFMQMAAYAKCEGMQVEQMMIVILNDKTEQGFSKPIISSEIDQYYQLFLEKRKSFKKRYGI